jgi:hypothetical protein
MRRIFAESAQDLARSQPRVKPLTAPQYAAQQAQFDGKSLTDREFYWLGNWSG